MIDDISWRPTASIETIKARSALYQQIRAFFMERGVLEVETPVLAPCGVTEPHIANLTVTCAAVSSTFRTQYLQTSPEYAMKRLIAGGVGDCFEITKVFRDDGVSKRHNPEFTLLEWYRLGFTDADLMEEIVSLLNKLVSFSGVRKVTYQQAFLETLGLCPLTCSSSDLVHSFEAEGLDCRVVMDDRNSLLDLAMSLLVEPSFPHGDLTFVTEYPSNQAALARVCEHDSRVAHRFEVFLGGLELANGYWELSDAAEQRRRFEADNKRRIELGLPEVPVDEEFLAALGEGLPDCAGVAMGLDRLLMLSLGRSNIKDVLAFPASV
ncbi:MAG: EF-P lysine aminoacylase GenX [Idiomarinaceae bacterium HL-53]|nr:MAG: EF-P lysine aminoacylase GenX [Idiomarinaceae bacterium HL-53]CUS48220.1 lysyl-tRNA synthetase, class 2 [Idiomarinaceae bacterium HL-53]